MDVGVTEPQGCFHQPNGGTAEPQNQSQVGFARS
jgi:hypothetical protein